jgi:hypothetical protein
VNGEGIWVIKINNGAKNLAHLYKLKVWKIYKKGKEKKMSVKIIEKE